MSSCEKYQELISAVLDGELTEEETAELQTHIAECDACRAMYEAFAAISGTIENEDVPDTLHRVVMERVNTAAKAKKIQRNLFRMRTVLTAAACLVVLVGTVLALKENVFRGVSKMKAADTAATEAYSLTSAVAAEEAAEDNGAYDMSADAFMAPGFMMAAAPNAEDDALAAGETESKALPAADGMSEVAALQQMTVEIRALTEDGFEAVKTEDGTLLTVRLTEDTQIADELGSVLEPGCVVTVEYSACSEAEVPELCAVGVYPTE